LTQHAVHLSHGVHCKKILTIILLLNLSSRAIPFFVVAGVCILAICLIYCRPLWKVCLCGYKWPFGSRARGIYFFLFFKRNSIEYSVNSPDSTPPNNNPVYANNDDLPDYDTIVKDSAMKDPTPPPYTFVAAHPNDFGIEARITSAPPQYHSRRSSLATTDPATPVEI
jgi:hypothetical protein